MKALTFKKTAIAAAVFATAGAANAANTLNVYKDIKIFEALVVAGTSGSVTLTAPTALSPYTIATERATDAAATVVASNDTAAGTANDENIQSDDSNLVIAYKAGSHAPRNGNLVKFTFTNGGIAGNSENYKLTSAVPITAAAVDAAAANTPLITFDDLTANVIAKEESNGVISSITFSLGEDTIINDTVFLVGTDSTADAEANIEVVDSLADVDLIGTIASPEIKLVKGAAAGAEVSVDVQIIDSSNGTEIAAAAVSPVKLATAKSGVTVTGFKSDADVIDYAKDALQLVDGKVANTDTDFRVQAKTSAAISSGLGFESAHVAKASFKVTATECAAVDTADNNKAADDVKIGGTGLTASTTEACTWTSGLINVSAADANLEVNLDGETLLKNATWSYEGKVSLATGDFTALTDNAIYAKEYKTVTGTAFTFTSDVQGDSFELPYIYHIGSTSGYFSFVKLVNKTAKSTAANATNMVEVAFDAVITNTISGEEFTVTNYKLGSVMNEGQMNFNGTDVIKALNEPTGKASDGFNETALTLDTAENYHIALTLIPRNVGDNANFYVDVQNTAPAGRAQGTAERK